LESDFGSVAIRGDGVAAYCCAHLLRNAGFQVSLERLDRPRVPAIMLSDTAVALIRDVFERPHLFADLPRIDRRAVAWGKAEAGSLPHSAVVVSETYLLENLELGLLDDTAIEPGFTVYTSRPLPPVAAELRFGTRRAAAVRAVLENPKDQSACWIESLENGWLFLLPNASESTWLLAIGASLDVLLAQSRIIAPRIEILPGRSGEFPACPRITSPLCGDSWLACGSVAMAFDPICGDGTAQAVREAILAAGLIRALAAGGDAASLYAHYEAILTAAMRRHLALSVDFYRTGGTGPWWQAELESLMEGHRWCTAKLEAAGEPRYQLQGFELIPRR
jgi:hypothetical protein